MSPSLESLEAIKQCLAQYFLSPWDTINLVEIARQYAALPVYADSPAVESDASRALAQGAFHRKR